MLAPIRDIRDELVDAYRREVEELQLEVKLLEGRERNLLRWLAERDKRIVKLQRVIQTQRLCTMSSCCERTIEPGRHFRVLPRACERKGCRRRVGDA